MSLTVFLALCILGIDFLIYALFQWTYGEKRGALARQLAAHKNSLKEQWQLAQTRRFRQGHNLPKVVKVAVDGTELSPKGM